VADDARHPATDHGLHPVLSGMTGADLVIGGRKAGGDVFVGRRLVNASFVPTRSAPRRIMAIGMDPEASGIRQFDLGGLSSIEWVSQDGEAHLLHSDDLARILGEVLG